MNDGVFSVYEGIQIGEKEFVGTPSGFTPLLTVTFLLGTAPLTQILPLKDFITDYQWLTKWIGNQALARQAGNRLKIMEKLFRSVLVPLASGMTPLVFTRY